MITVKESEVHKMRFWDNDFDRLFDEALDELEREEKEKNQNG